MLNAISTLGLVAMVAGLIALLLTRRLFSPFPLVVAVQIGAVVLMAWARITFGRRSFHFAADPTQGGLVTTGPYRYIRHPIYTAVCLFVTAGAAAHLSLTTVLLLAVVWGGAIARMLCEEQLLVQKYPEYQQYAARTPRMLPFLF